MFTITSPDYKQILWVLQHAFELLDDTRYVSDYDYDEFAEGVDEVFCEVADILKRATCMTQTDRDYLTYAIRRLEDLREHEDTPDFEF